VDVSFCGREIPGIGSSEKRQERVFGEERGLFEEKGHGRGYSMMWPFKGERYLVKGACGSN
jgi:hypothetical protein